MSVMFLCFALRITEMAGEPVNIGARKIKDVLYFKKETLDIFIRLNKMHSISQGYQGEVLEREKKKKKKTIKITFLKHLA